MEISIDIKCKLFGYVEVVINYYEFSSLSIMSLFFDSFEGLKFIQYWF